MGRNGRWQRVRKCSDLHRTFNHNMTRIRRILLALVVIFLMAQFLRPDRSVPAHDPATDLLVMTAAPPEIASMVRNACYDCHSYETEYPWYVAITPINWFMQDHIDHARGHLNFSRWDEDGGSKDAGKCGKLIRKDEMPLSSYTPLHPEARLSPKQKETLAAWFDQVSGARRGSKE